jgi:hypothetical protein
VYGRFEKGNKLAAKSKLFEAALRRSLAEDDYAKLRACADKVRDLAAAGERWAVELLRDTFDGKPAQQVIATDEEGRSLAIGLIAYAEVRPDAAVPLPAPALSTTYTEEAGQRH